VTRFTINTRELKGRFFAGTMPRTAWLVLVSSKLPNGYSAYMKRLKTAVLKMQTSDLRRLQGPMRGIHDALNLSPINSVHSRIFSGLILENWALWPYIRHRFNLCGTQVRRGSAGVALLPLNCWKHCHLSNVWFSGSCLLNGSYPVLL
jgi:hypothetical protein